MSSFAKLLSGIRRVKPILLILLFFQSNHPEQLTSRRLQCHIFLTKTIIPQLNGNKHCPRLITAITTFHQLSHKYGIRSNPYLQLKENVSCSVQLSLICGHVSLCFTNIFSLTHTRMYVCVYVCVFG